MPDKPLVGGSKWDQEGIQAAKAFWVEVEAYRDAIITLMPHINDQDLRNQLLQYLNAQGSSLLGLRDALHTLEVIGLEAKKDRLNNGKSSQGQT